MENQYNPEDKPITAETELLLEEIAEAVKNINLVNEGKLKARPAEELLNI